MEMTKNASKQEEEKGAHRSFIAAISAGARGNIGIDNRGIKTTLLQPKRAIVVIILTLTGKLWEFSQTRMIPMVIGVLLIELVVITGQRNNKSFFLEM